jgi:hypothetical protein
MCRIWIFKEKQNGKSGDNKQQFSPVFAHLQNSAGGLYPVSSGHRRGKREKGKKKNSPAGMGGICDRRFAADFPVCQQHQKQSVFLFYHCRYDSHGLYSITYYRFFYQKSLEKVLAKQHASTPYLQSDITIDLYEDKLTEHVQDKQADTPWESIHEIKSTDALLMLMLDSKRCLLIPKSQLTPEELEKLERLLNEVSEKYGKPRYAV